MTRQPMRSVARPLAAAAVVGACAAVWHGLPTRSEVYAPFPVAGTLGVPAEGRGLAATVSGVQIAPKLEIQSDRFRPAAIEAIGRWLVLETDIRSADRPERAHAELQIGADRYLPADRLPPWATMGETLQPGFVTRGAWVFDVAAPELADQQVTLRTWVGDGFLDSRLDISIDLRDQRVVQSDTAALRPTQVVVE